jgi:hypothetical protein
MTTNAAAHTERIILKATPVFRGTLQAASRRTGVPMSDIVRRAVSEYLKRVPRNLSSLNPRKPKPANGA